MSEFPNTAVVILAWNGRKYLEKFLPSVVEHSAIPNCDVYVADNMSTDDSIEFLKRNFPSVHIIQNKRNGGFAGGYNDALAEINAKYYILLNQDVEVTEDWIQPVITMLENDENIVAAQPKLRAFNQKTHFEYAGAAGGLLDRFGYPFCRGRIFYEIEEDLGQYDDPYELFWATGACMFIRAEEYHKAGGLDEDFFAHMEEIDLCWRLKNKGFSIMYCPDSTVYHLGGGSLPQGNPKKTYLNFRNNLIMIYKNVSRRNFLFILLVRLFLDGAAAGYSLFIERRPKNVLAILKAHFSFYFDIVKWTKKRRKVQKERSSQNSSGLLRRSLVFQFFIRGKKTFKQLKPYMSESKASA
ncbi:MAG: glycosyltransferase family 2 protein [Chitinophagales bacterium]|nr:glycosyltransferase family 2 protein [Chitinophagales bacterium]